MNNAYKFLTFDEQIEHLQKNRKLKIVDKNKMLSYLRKYNYENFVNNYSKFLINKDTREFLDGGTSETLISIFNFDRHISSILLNDVLEIERFVTTSISYVIPKKWKGEIKDICTGNILKLKEKDFRKIFPKTIIFSDNNESKQIQKKDLIKYVPKKIVDMNPSLWKILCIDQQVF